MPVTLERLQGAEPTEVAAIVLSENENQWFDRKSQRIKPQRLAESLVALANADGGTLVIGAHDCTAARRRQGAPTPQSVASDRTGLHPAAGALRLPSGRLRQSADGEDDHLFVIDVSPGEQVHATTKDEVFLRVGDSNRKLNFEQRLELQYDRGDTTFEASVPPSARDLALNAEAVSEYAELLSHPEPERLLRARALVDLDDRPNAAGLLLFGTAPQRAFPQAWVRVTRYEGAERRTGGDQNVVHDVACEGTLPLQIDAARDAISELVPRRRALGADGRFQWLPIVPEEVWD